MHLPAPAARNRSPTTTDVAMRHLIKQLVAVAFVASAAVGNASANEPTSEKQITVRMAGGAMEVQLPTTWRIWEVPYGREIRFVLAEETPTGRFGMPHNGIWLSYHADSPAARGGEQALLEMMSQRIRSAAGNQTRLAEPETVTLAGRQAVRRMFDVYTVSQSQHTLITGQGFHYLVQAPGAIVEIHGVLPMESFAVDAPAFDQIIQSLAFHRLAAAKHTMTAKTRDAEVIVGSWKAFRSLLRIKPNGRILLRLDAKNIDDFEVGTGRDDAGEWLTGDFEARQDLLLVKWDDGSRSNYRWRLKGDQLLLTDHDGQISQLKRLW